MNFSGRPDGPAPSWSIEFDDWAQRALAAQDLDSLIDFLHKAPAARIAHPRTEHFAPLFVPLARRSTRSARHSVVDGFWYGLSKRSWQIG